MSSFISFCSASGLIGSQPLVTIVTVVYNGRRHLQTAIDSLRSQNYPNIEYLVIDGGSTDGTLDIIRANEDVITDWISEPDDGIYDAMNKGINRSNGVYIGLLNADDTLLPCGVEKAVKALEEIGEPGYTCAAVELINETGAVIGTSIPFPEKQRLRRRFLEMPCPHLGVFVHRQVYEQLGTFDTFFRLSADYDLLLRFIDHNVPCARIEEAIGQFRLGGVSGGRETWKERFSVHRKHDSPLAFSLYAYFRSNVKSGLASVLPVYVKKRIRLILPSKNQYK